MPVRRGDASPDHLAGNAARALRWAGTRQYHSDL
jgi:hypothetical protein